MKSRLMLGLILCLSTSVFGQLPYTWTAGVNPGWTSTPVSGSQLQWQAGCSFVTTNCTGNYQNNSLSVYMSPVMNMTCTNASTANVTFTAFGSTEYGFDFLFIEYSMDGGTTWINPYGVGVGWTGNFGPSPGLTIPAITTPTSGTMRYRLVFQSDGNIRDSGLKITDFDVVCNVVLPVEIADFSGKVIGNEHVLTWSSLTERKCDYYEIEYSTNPDFASWTLLNKVSGQGNSEIRHDYETTRSNPEVNKQIYYRLISVDTDGKRQEFDDYVVLQTNVSNKQILMKTDLLGKLVTDDYHGLVLLVYEDGTILKTFQ